MRIIESIKKVAIVQLTQAHTRTLRNQKKGHIFHSSDNTSVLSSPLFNDIFGASRVQTT